MPTDSPTPVRSSHRFRSFATVFLCLLALLFIVFHALYTRGYILFANDAPLGQLMPQTGKSLGNYRSLWIDSYWLGGSGIRPFPNFSNLLFTAVDQILHDLSWFYRLYTPLSLLILGLSAWYAGRKTRWHPLVCLLVAIAAAFNTDPFSNACWGLPSRALTFASSFFAIGLLSDAVASSGWRNWARLVLAGFAVGFGLTEGYDVGAIFSLYVAAFAIFVSLNEPGTVQARLLRGGLCVGLVAVFAAIFSAQTLITLVQTQVKGVVGMEQDEQTKVRHWDEATQWSLPPVETLRVAISGLFGYRMETPNGGNYWGTVGQDPSVPELKKSLSDPREEVRAQAAAFLQNRWRFSGSGEYAGVLVVLVALWALVRSFRGGTDSLPITQRRAIWFWSGAGLISLLLAWGRYAPFYQIVYALPYFSTIRNPIKFMHPFQFSVLMLFGYGLHDLLARYVLAVATPGKTQAAPARFMAWWRTAPAFDKKWIIGCLVALGIGFLAWMALTAKTPELIAYLQNNGLPQDNALAISKFCSRQLGLFLLFLAAATALLGLILARCLAGRVGVGATLLGTLLFVDLWRASTPWMVMYHYTERYPGNPIFDFLSHKPYEHRVTILPFQVNQELSLLQSVYTVEWVQHQFPYYQIQTLDMPQDPRRTEEKARYLATVSGHLLRYWQLTNTRYLFGLAQLVEPLNQQLDPQLHRFKLHTLFALQQESPGGPIGLQTNTVGPYALIEFAGALPRAQLFTNWLSIADSQAALEHLTNAVFNPLQSVIINTKLPAPATNLAMQASAGTVSFTSYAPERVVLQANAPAPSVLMLDDRYDPYWKAQVDQRPQEVLRCDSMVQGVFLQPGQHVVELRYEPPGHLLYISLAALAVACVLAGALGIYPEASGAPVPPTSNPPPLTPRGTEKRSAAPGPRPTPTAAPKPK